LKFAVSSTDAFGNEGPRSPEVTISIDRIAPEMPTNFTIG